MGIIPEASKKTCKKQWEVFFNRFNNETKYKIIPYYANSYDEAIEGFKYGSLDLLYINPATFLTLRRNYNAKAILYHKIPPKETNQLRAILVAGKNTGFINQTKKQKLTFGSKYSMTGYLAPHKYLAEKLKMPLSTWFSSLSYAASKSEGIKLLQTGKTDILATDMTTFKNAMKKNNKDNLKYNVIWISTILPEPLICINKNSKYYDSEILEKIQDKLWKSILKRKNYNLESMEFEPLNYDYNKRLKELEKYLEEDKNKKTKDLNLLKKLNR